MYLVPGKQCTKCKIWYEATLENFYKHKNGLTAQCKKCVVARSSDWYTLYKDKVEVKQRKKENLKKWRKNNPERVKLNAKKWQKANPDKVKLFRDKGLESKKISNKKWKKENKILQNLYLLRRRARKRGLPDTLTPEQYDHMFVYFNNKCTVCAETENLQLDHWIPLASEHCPGTVVTNIVPLCPHCNTSKGSKLPHVWLMQKFGNGFFAMAVWLKVFNYFKSIKG